MTQIERRAFALSRATSAETRDADGATGDKLAGYAIVFNADSHDLGGFVERVAPTALKRSLDQAAAGERNLFALWSHDSSQPLGSTRGGKLVLAQDDTGLSFELDTTRFNPMQLDAARDGDLQMSFGFIVRQDSWVQRDDGVYERTLIDVDLLEVSPVISPAYPDTTAAMRSLEAFKAEAACRADAKPLDQIAPQGEGASFSIDPTKVFVDPVVTTLASRTAELATTTTGNAVVAAMADAYAQCGVTRETPQENTALKIKRTLLKRALEQHISRLPQV